jgi:hypothetical protein
MKVVVKTNNLFKKDVCELCGGTFESDMVLAYAFEDHADTTDRSQSFGYVCFDCLDEPTQIQHDLLLDRMYCLRFGCTREQLEAENNLQAGGPF